jgi:hypothetical protein
MVKGAAHVNPALRIFLPAREGVLLTPAVPDGNNHHYHVY